MNLKSCKHCLKLLSKSASRKNKTGLCRSCWDKTKKGKQPMGGFIKGQSSWNKGKHWNQEIKNKIKQTKTGSSWGKHTNVTKKLLSSLKMGDKNPAFIHGNGYRGYCLKFVNIRPKILKRDNYTCQHCNQYGTRGHNILTIHHIDYNKENNNKNNLITLCLKCNIKANWNIDYWFAYFKFIIIRENGVSKIA